MNNTLTIGQAAHILDVNVDTLRRWEKAGELVAVRSEGGHRYYKIEDINNYLKKYLLKYAEKWVEPENDSPENLPPLFYYPNSNAFNNRLIKLQNRLKEVPRLSSGLYSIISAIVGEIGDNSYSHNLGNWPDVRGVFFGYNLDEKKIVLADRGQGVLKTLKRIKPELTDSADALRVAFTELISGRPGERRGNGLKFVKKEVIKNNLNLTFKTGNAKLTIGGNVKDLKIRTLKKTIQGCLVLIQYN